MERSTNSWLRNRPVPSASLPSRPAEPRGTPAKDRKIKNQQRYDNFVTPTLYTLQVIWYLTKSASEKIFSTIWSANFTVPASQYGLTAWLVLAYNKKIIYSCVWKTGSKYGSGINIPNHISGSLVYSLSIQFVDPDQGSGAGIRDGKIQIPNSRSATNIPDPQH